jgi:hypothetical protein
VSNEDLSLFLELVIDFFADKVPNYDLPALIRICNLLHLRPVLVGDLEAFKVELPDGVLGKPLNSLNLRLNLERWVIGKVHGIIWGIYVLMINSSPNSHLN